MGNTASATSSSVASSVAPVGRLLRVLAVGVLMAAGGGGARPDPQVCPAVTLSPPRSPSSSPSSSKFVFSPYFESYKSLDLAAVPSKSVTLAFLLGNARKELAWDGTMPLDEWRARAKASGKDVVLSFGGASGTELAVLQRDPKKLARAYAAAARMYGAARLDFDIEGAGVADAATVALRNKALALLPAGLALQYTLPVMPFGLDASCLALLRDAKARGVPLDVVNVMTMDFGGSFTGDMGDYAIQAAKAVRRQLRELGLGGVGVGITPMIGHNDVQGEVFTLEDARQVARFAARTSWVRFVGFWAAGRDNGRRSSLSDSSMLPQRDWDFVRAFSQ